VKRLGPIQLRAALLAKGVEIVRDYYPHLPLPTKRDLSRVARRQHAHDVNGPVFTKVLGHVAVDETGREVAP
jgi:hypothetical protein